MKIAVSADLLLGPLTGMGRWTRELLHALPRVAPDLDITLFHARTEGARAKIEETLGAGMRTVELPFTRKWMLTRGLAGGRPIDAWVGQHDAWFFPSMIALPARSGAIISSIHDLAPFHEPAAYTLRDRVMTHAWSRAVARRADAIVTVSRYSARDIASRLCVDPGAIHVVPNGVGPAFAPAPARAPDTAPYVFYCGVINRRKNVATLVRAFRDAMPRLPSGTRLVLAGPRGVGWDEIERALDSSAALRERVDLPGFVDDATLARLHRGALVFAYPSRFEGFGIPPLEAMACGVPVVASAASSIPEIVGDAALLVSPDDAEGWREALVRAATDAAWRDAAIARGVKTAAGYTWESAAQKLASVLREAAS